jgi:TRAP-type mannitol/chloroaromatic compound transport system permease small subunit
LSGYPAPPLWGYNRYQVLFGISMSQTITALINSIDRFTEVSGRVLSWLTILMVVLVVVVVITRYFLEIGSIALQESVTYLHAMVFMLGLAFTLKRGGHVRVDIFYRGYSIRGKAIVDLLGGLLFLLPFCLLIFISSWDYVLASWAIGEGSSENSGIAAIYLLKTLMLIMPATLLLQGVAEILKALLVLRNPLVPPVVTDEVDVHL